LIWISSFEIRNLNYFHKFQIPATFFKFTGTACFELISLHAINNSNKQLDQQFWLVGLWDSSKQPPVNHSIPSVFSGAVHPDGSDQRSVQGHERSSGRSAAVTGPIYAVAGLIS